MKEISKYWEVVQLDVCGHCVDSDGKGTCRLPGNTECGLKRYFPDVVESILSVQSDKLGPYEKALRENVCAICEHQLNDGECLVRTHIDCGLDRYFPMVVESIESLAINQDGRLTQDPGIR
jgi:hypothetical protein